MQLTAPQPRRHKVLMSFRYWNAWDVIFFDTDRFRVHHAFYPTLDAIAADRANTASERAMEMAAEEAIFIRV